jgi:hypothetical protein
MGPALCAKLAAMMHGEVGVASTPGQGATFYLSAEFARAGGSESGHGGSVELSIGPLLGHDWAKGLASPSRARDR